MVSLMTKPPKSISTYKVRSLDEVDWQNWIPPVQATLVFILQGSQVLLIHKKTGLGQGKVNAPGGKREEGESFLECAHRELHEEVGLTTPSLVECAHLRFLMSDHPDIECKVFLTRDYQGQPQSTREAHPFWCSIDQIPWDQMWQDDQLWLPLVLQGQYVDAFFSFKEEELYEESIVCKPHAEQAFFEHTDLEQAATDE